MRLAMLGFAVLIVLAGCQSGPRAAFDQTEADAVAWWIEDVSRGVPRRPGELELDDASPGLLRLAAWAKGADTDAGWQPPDRIAARRRRYGTLRAAFAQGSVVMQPGTGLVAPRPGLPAGDDQAAAAVADRENDDRRYLDALVLALVQASPGPARIFRDAMRRIRRELDLAAGGGEWLPAAKPASPDRSTPPSPSTR